MEKVDYAEDVSNLYKHYQDQAIPLTEHHALMAGLVVERLFPPADEHAAFSILAALNLLNAVVKLPWGKDVVGYSYIKGMAASLFARLLSLPLPNTEVYLDMHEQVAYFKVMGVQISFHYIPLYREILWQLRQACLRRQTWAGMHLQQVAVELFQLACPHEMAFQSRAEEHLTRTAMLNFRRLEPSRIFSYRCQFRSRIETIGRPGQRIKYSEDKSLSLHSALNFNIWTSTVFMLWRRKDRRFVPMMRYDGTNYRVLQSYLLGPRNRIYRRPESTMQLGKLYYISPQKRLRCVSPSQFVLSLTRNNYLLEGSNRQNLCITYGIARYLSVLYPKLRFVCTLNYNRLTNRRRYYNRRDLYNVALNSKSRSMKVWIVVDPAGLLNDFDVDTLPKPLIDDYMAAEDYYQEFEIVASASGLKGIYAYSRFHLLPTVYRDISIHNYHAHVLGKNGKWAIYALCEERFKTGFIYDRIWYDSPRGAIMAQVDGREVYIFRFRFAS